MHVKIFLYHCLTLFKYLIFTLMLLMFKFHHIAESVPDTQRSD